MEVDLTAEEFRSRLASLGFNQTTFAQAMVTWGDPRPFPTILRAVSGYARGESRVPGELVVLLRLLASRLPVDVAARPVGRGRPRMPPAGSGEAVS